MTTSFMQSPKYFFTSESVNEGHPDKICDQIADAILDALIAQDPASRVACEVATTTGLILVAGEITTNGWADIAEIARNVVLDIGYDRAKYGFDGATCGVIVSVKGQSPDIALGVDRALEAKTGEMTDTDIEATGAGDQGMMFGFACDETEEYMPLTISLAHKLCKQLAVARKSGELPYLRPDGKAQVTVQYAYGKPQRVDAVVVSTQHAPEIEHDQIYNDVLEHVIKTIIPAEYLDDKTHYFINPTGRFVTGGPMGDSGVTGRKIIVDTYGGVARHGGGAFSGKDPTKVDRSAAYMARYIAKNLVAAGIAERLELQVAYAIGVAHPLSLAVETFGTAKVPEDLIIKLVEDNFDLRPAAIIRYFDLRRPIYRATSNYGHFGRHDIDAPWEKLDKVEILKKAAGLA